MRLDNLTEEEKRRFRTDITFLKDVVSEEYLAILESLVDFPLEKLGELRGQAKFCRNLLKLL